MKDFFMKKNVLLGGFMALSLYVFAAMPVYAQSKFFSVMPDLPVADGFVERTDSILMFDKPEGRLLDFSAEGHTLLACQRGLPFYTQTLPYLGWRMDKTGFVREGERLEIRLEQVNAALCVLHLSVRPE